MKYKLAHLVFELSPFLALALPISHLFKSKSTDGYINGIINSFYALFILFTVKFGRQLQYNHSHNLVLLFWIFIFHMFWYAFEPTPNLELLLISEGVGIFMTLAGGHFAKKERARLRKLLEPMRISPPVPLLEVVQADLPTVDEENLECSICLEPILLGSGVKLRCNHEFHSRCMSDLIRYQNTCPLCRRRIDA